MQRKLSLSADEYIRMTPHISDDGEITLGLKKTTAFLVDAKTGRVVRTYKFDNSASKVGVQVFEGNAVMLSKDAGELVESGDVDLGAFKHLVYITRTDYVLQHYSPNSSEILWNVAFADIEGEFRCQGIQSSFDGVPPNANEDTDETEWQLPCQKKTVALRIRDHGMFEFDKLAITHLGGGANFLPVPYNKPPFGHVPRFQPALPTSGDIPVLALPSSEGKNPGILAPFSGNSGTVNAITPSSENIAKSHVWPFITAVLSIMGFIFYKFLASRKQGKLNKPIEELQPRSGMPKKKKNRRSGNNKSNPNNLKNQKYLSLQSKVGEINELTRVERDERKLLLTFTDHVDGRVDGRRIGKLLVSNKEIAKGSNGTVVLEGIYDGRHVAVKRLVQSHHDVALKEIQNLIASDQHPNIVRWYGVEYDQDFVYLALERCTCSLNDLIYVNSESFQNQIPSKDMDSNRLPEYMVRLHSMPEHNRNVELWKANGYPSVQLLKLMRSVNIPFLFISSSPYIGIKGGDWLED